MILTTLSMSGTESLSHMFHSASSPNRDTILVSSYLPADEYSLRYAAVESARTDDDASYRIHSQVKAGKRPRTGEERVG